MVLSPTPSLGSTGAAPEDRLAAPKGQRISQILLNVGPGVPLRRMRLKGRRSLCRRELCSFPATCLITGTIRSVTSGKPARHTGSRLTLHPVSPACLPSFPGTVTRPALSCHLDPSVNMASLGPPASHPSKSPALLSGRAHLSTGHVLSCSCLFMAYTPIPPLPSTRPGPCLLHHCLLSVYNRAWHTGSTQETSAE